MSFQPATAPLKSRACKSPPSDTPTVPEDGWSDDEALPEIDVEAEAPPIEATDEDEAAPASVKAGAAVIRTFWKHAPKGPRRVPDDRRRP